MNTDLTLTPNTMYYGDCLDIMQPWADAYREPCVDLIYLDPPFNSNANYNILYGKDQTGRPRDERSQFVAFKDTWWWSDEAAARIDNIRGAVGHPAHNAMRGLSLMLPEGGMLAYLSYMAERLAVMPRLLKASGSIYLHCDPTASHYLKAIMDDIFGAENFRNDVVWCYSSTSQASRWYPKKHDYLLFYSASEESTCNTANSGSKAEMAARTANGKIVEDWWQDIPALNSMARERLGWPTQKPIELLERIIAISTNKGDLVLDPFCGCGTAAEAAWKLGRKFLGIDISPYAITRVCRDRLKDAEGVSMKGLPGDMASVRELLQTEKGRFVFEHWAVSCLPGYKPNDKQVADGGIDGRGRMLNPPAGEDGFCVAQVKGGRFTPADLRAFLSQVQGGKFSMGVFITAEKQAMTPTMREVAAAAGSFQVPGGARTYHRIVFWSIEEYFDGVEPRVPEMRHPFTGRAMHREIPTRF